MDEQSQKAIDKKHKQAGKLNKWLIVLLAILLLVIASLLSLLVFRGDNTSESPELPNKEPVVLTLVEERTFERFISVQGNLESKNFALVSPRIAGTLDEICVDEGDDVTADETMLFKTDSVKLQEAVEVQKQLLSVEESSLKKSAAALEKTKADFYKADLDYHRFERLFEKKAVTADAFEQQQSRYKQLQAAVKLAEADVELSQANLEKVKADLAMARKDLADAVIYAPLTGKISMRFKEPKEMGNPGEPVVRIDNTSLIEASAYLPAQHYTEVIPQQTMVKVVVSGRDTGEFAVYYKSPTINPQLRTFEIKCIIDNSSQVVAPGAMAKMRVILEQRKGLSVPTTAIQVRNNKPVVFTVTGGKAHKVTVQTGIENDGSTEIITDELEKEDLVVTMGQEMLEEGRPVSIQQESN